jgi:peptidoglycan-associated lipoprotein
MIRKLGLLMLVLALTLALGCGKDAPEIVDDPTTAPPTEVIPEEPVAEEQEPVDVVPSGPTAEDYARMAPQEYGIEDLFFAFDEYTLSTEAMMLLEASARVMKEHDTLVYVVEGHCDERGTVEYNLALGEKRAIAARDYLVSLGVPATQLRITSYGEERPFSRGSGESAWALNRRAHFSRP